MCLSQCWVPLGENIFYITKEAETTRKELALKTFRLKTLKNTFKDYLFLPHLFPTTPSSPAHTCFLQHPPRLHTLDISSSSRAILPSLQKLHHRPAVIGSHSQVSQLLFVCDKQQRRIYCVSDQGKPTKKGRPDKHNVTSRGSGVLFRAACDGQ